MKSSSKADLNKINEKISEVSSKTNENYYSLSEKIYEVNDQLKLEISNFQEIIEEADH